MLPLSLLSRHHPDAQVALQQSLILQDDNLQVNERSIGNQDRSVICQKTVKPFTQLNEHSQQLSLHIWFRFPMIITDRFEP